MVDVFDENSTLMMNIYDGTFEKLVEQTVVRAEQFSLAEFSEFGSEIIDTPTDGTMTDKDTQQHGTYVEQVIETVASWPEITTEDGRFNATTFQIGTGQIGHVHPGGTVDISYPPPLRDQLIADDRTGEHHVAPNSPTGTTFYIESVADIDNAVWLLRLSYLHHVLDCQKNEGTEADSELTDIDVEAELDELDPSDALRSAFETTAGHSP